MELFLRLHSPMLLIFTLGLAVRRCNGKYINHIRTFERAPHQYMANASSELKFLRKSFHVLESAISSERYHIHSMPIMMKLSFEIIFEQQKYGWMNIKHILMPSFQVSDFQFFVCLE